MVEGEAEVWLVAVASVAPPDEASLSDGERARADRFRRGEDRASYVAAHVTLRSIVGERLARDPASLPFDAWPCPLCGGPHGRPRIADATDLHLSLAHAGGLIAVALADVPVGVDVESTSRRVTLDDLLPAMHPAELPRARDRAAALRQWVRKEAYLKGLGTGLGIEPATVDLSTDPPGWRVRDVDAPGGYVAAVAVATGSPA